ncbi:tetratricopeptide repeat protein [candidate division KSB1 bacterium]|nr:tetratricopeptide repeat protein [candidate division KSB1 bacterium]
MPKKLIIKGLDMKTETCVICLKAKGRRVCRIKDNLLICPICCAKTRRADCEGCIYFTQAEKYKNEKSITPKSKPFMMEIDPEVNEKVDRALAMAEKGNLNRAEGIISVLLNEYSHIDMVQYGMGVVCLMKNKYDEAISYFDKAIEINPYFVEAWYNKGAAHQQRLEMPQMIEAYRKTVELGDYSEHYVIHAKTILRDLEGHIRKSNNLSLDEYLESAAIFNEAFNAMIRMEWEKAISGFKKVLSMDPRHTQSYGNLGICYGYLGRKQEALANLDRALELDPNYEPAITNRAVINSLSDGEKLAIKKFQSVEYYKDIASKKKSLIKKIFK